MAQNADATPKIVVPDSAAAGPVRAPAPSPPPSPAPGGLIHFTVTAVAWRSAAGQGTTCQVDASADTWAQGSGGALSLTVSDASLDHLRVGDRLTLAADPRAGT